MWVSVLVTFEFLLLSWNFALGLETTLTEWVLSVERKFLWSAREAHLGLESELFLTSWKMLKTSPFHGPECKADFVRLCH